MCHNIIRFEWLDPVRDARKGPVPLVGAMILCCAFLITGCEPKARISPEEKDLRDRYDQIEQDMKEAEVIEIFEGYESGAGELVREVDPNSKPLKRPSKFARMFYEKKGVQEGDYFVEVYFDEAGYVVGKHLGGFCR
jgi:hypothetical protein